MMSTAYKKVELVELIKVVSLNGKGESKDDPIKEIIQFWTKDGKLLFTENKN